MSRLRKLQLILQLLFFCLNLQAQKRVVVTGIVIDSQTQTVISGASISTANGSLGTSSDSNGKWEIQLPPGKHLLQARHFGYHPDSVNLLIQDKPLVQNFQLLPDTLRIAQVNVEAQARTWNLTRLDPGQMKLATEELSKIPSLLGSKDPLGSLRSLPGIQSVGEGTGYFYIRGGGADHNLITLDEAIIYHPAHLLGLYSVVNPSAINSINLYKGGIPANYGNRLASVIDMDTKDGNFQKWTGELSLGLIASQFHLEGPLVKDKLSVLLAFRRTHLDLIYPLLLPKSNPFHGSKYAFFDWNGKISWRINAKNTLRISGYSGNDRFQLEDAEIVLSDRVKWGNNTLSLLVNSELTSRLELKSSLSYSGYGIGFAQQYRDYLVSLNSGLDNLRLKEELLFRLNPNQLIRWGVELNRYSFKPYKIAIDAGNEMLSFGDSIPYQARDLAGFMDFRWNIKEQLILQAGIRVMHFEHRSPFRRYILNSNGFPVDSVYSERGHTLASYTRPEPRLSLSWLSGPHARLKLSASRNFQSVHMVPLSTSTLPLDLWLPSTEIIQPQSSNSFSLGWFQDVPDKKMELSVEAFYRNMNHLVDFSEYQTIMGLVKNNMDQQMSFGTGVAYGLELFIRKNAGKYKGWIGYTLSKTRHLFPDINNGQPFAPRQDRLHDLNIFITKELGTKWEASVQFIYASGQPTTIPLSYYVVNGNVIQYYNDRNTLRLPAYHRLDFAISRNPDRIKKWQSSWTFSIYNLYNRINPFFVYYDLSWDYEKNLLLSKGRKIGLLPVLPSLSWTLKF